jgi:pimeloyl-ACP methyl ester carboxylesterase
MSSIRKTGRSRVHVSGFDVDVIDEGCGRPVLFLHSGEGPDFPSRRYIDLLAKNFRVIAPWHPGFGQSSLPPDVRQIEDLAYFYLDLAMHYKLHDAILIGASFGGWIAAEIAVRSLERFSNLILVDPVGIRVGQRDDRDIADIYMTSSWDWPQLFYHAPEIGTVDYNTFSDDDLMGIARSREAMALFGWCPYMHNPSLKRWLPRIHIPTLLIWGSEDKVVSPAYGQAYCSALPDGQFALIEKAGHFPHIERPEEFVKLVRNFC